MNNFAVAAKWLNIALKKPDGDAKLMVMHDATFRAYREEEFPGKVLPTQDIERSLYDIPHDLLPPRMSNVWLKWTEELVLLRDYFTLNFPYVEGCTEPQIPPARIPRRIPVRLYVSDTPCHSR